MDEFGIAQAQPVVNPTAGKIADLLRKTKEFGNQYEVKNYVPFFGGTGIGDLFLGQAPEEVNRWSYGDYPFRNPSSVVGTGGNRLDVWKTGRFEPTFDVVANVALPAVGTAQMAGRTAKTLAPKAGQMAENYMFNQGMMPSIVPPSPTKVAEALRQPAKNELGFYSPLDEAVMNLQNQKGTGQQYLAQLLKTQGVKQEEVSTRGLDTFLTENPKVTKTQIEDFLGQNPVNIKETVLGVPEKLDANRLKQLETEYAGLKEHAIDDPKFGEVKYNEMIRLQNIRDNSTLDSLYARAEADERTAQRMQQLGLKDEAEKYFRQAELLNTRAEKLDLEELGPALPTKFGKPDFNIPNGQNYREVLIQYEPKRDPLNYVVKELPNADGTKNFGAYKIDAKGNVSETPTNTWFGRENAEDWVSGQKANVGEYGNFVNRSHFEQPNILVHMRVDDRVIDGKKTLFIQEIQSDWHQAGRKKGYQTPKGTLPEGHTVSQEMNADNQPVWVVRDKTGESVGFGYNKQESINSLRPTGVPDAPFKNTEQWAGLAMKRAMQMATEGGYDRVAFTTGKQQADRYNLRKSIEELHYSGSDLVAYDGSGKKVISQTGVRPEDLPDLVGKEAAEKLLNQPKQGTLQSLTGQDLEVGGEGMKGFYDKILPELVNKYGKKNGLKVGKTKMRTSTDKQATEDAKLLNDLGVSKGGPNAYEEVHYFDLTPQAKESFLSKGQPLFAVPPAMAITDEDSRRDMLEKLFNSQ